MPSKRAHLGRHLRPDSLPSEAVQQYLLTGIYDDAVDDIDYWSAVYDIIVNNDRAAWDRVSPRLLAEWVTDHPGTRPWAWWRFDAPREPLDLGVDQKDRMHAHRRRLGGTGDAAQDKLNYKTEFNFGLPTEWIDKATAEDLPRRMPDVYEPGWAQAVDPADPPRYESEASFLERHNLFMRGERERLPADAFAPEVIVPDEDDDAD